MSVHRISRISMGLDCRPIILESCNVSPFVVGPRASPRLTNFLPRANSSLLRLQHHQVKKADSSTFLLNAARSIYWQGAIFDRQQRSRNVRNLLVSLATLLYVTVAPLCLPSIIKGIINHLEMRCIFHTYHAVQS